MLVSSVACLQNGKQVAGSKEDYNKRVHNAIMHSQFWLLSF